MYSKLQTLHANKIVSNFIFKSEMYRESNEILTLICLSKNKLDFKFYPTLCYLHNFLCATNHHLCGNTPLSYKIRNPTILFNL